MGKIIYNEIKIETFENQVLVTNNNHKMRSHKMSEINNTLKMKSHEMSQSHPRIPVEQHPKRKTATKVLSKSQLLEVIWDARSCTASVTL